jgi:hypothetical protein
MAVTTAEPERKSQRPPIPPASSGPFQYLAGRSLGGLTPSVKDPQCCVAGTCHTLVMNAWRDSRLVPPDHLHWAWARTSHKITMGEISWRNLDKRNAGLVSRDSVRVEFGVSQDPQSSPGISSKRHYIELVALHKSPLSPLGFPSEAAVRHFSDRGRNKFVPRFLRAVHHGGTGRTQ